MKANAHGCCLERLIGQAQAISQGQALAARGMAVSLHPRKVEIEINVEQQASKPSWRLACQLVEQGGARWRGFVLSPGRARTQAAPVARLLAGPAVDLARPVQRVVQPLARAGCRQPEPARLEFATSHRQRKCQLPEF